MNTSRALIAIGLSCALFSACKPRTLTRDRLGEQNFPRTILWAWERPEDLRFVDAHRYAIAFLAQTLTLKGDEVAFNPRHQPLEVSPETKMLAVTRIESQKITGQKPALSAGQRERLVKLIMQTLELPRVSAIQIDFDALVSEREFYRALLQDLRRQMPEQMPLSMTALASFCMGDRWLNDLPVDEAVPMIFRMGADDRAIKSMLANGNDFGEPLCRRSYGISVDEPLEMKFNSSRRIYVFNNHPWNQNDLISLQQRIQP